MLALGLMSAGGTTTHSQSPHRRRHPQFSQALIARRKTLAAKELIMFKKSMCGALLTVLCCLPVASDAATCRAGQAAVEGSKAGYEQAKRAADVWAQKERTMSD